VGVVYQEMVDAFLRSGGAKQVGAFGFVSDGLMESVELGAGGVVDDGGL
jgi:hypothetical protein